MDAVLVMPALLVTHMELLSVMMVRLLGGGGGGGGEAGAGEYSSVLNSTHIMTWFLELYYYHAILFLPHITALTSHVSKVTIKITASLVEHLCFLC